MIIFEGCDGSGKSTLVSKIWPRIVGPDGKAPVSHSPGPLAKGLYKWAIEHLNEAKEIQIFDRFPYFSESVYGPVLRGSKTSFLDIWEFLELRDRLIAYEPLIIVCRPPRNLIIGRTSLVRTQMSGVLEHIEEIIDRYDRMSVHWAKNFRVITYDFTHEDADPLIFTKIQEYLKEDSERGVWDEHQRL